VVVTAGAAGIEGTIIASIWMLQKFSTMSYMTHAYFSLNLFLFATYQRHRLVTFPHGKPSRLIALALPKRCRQPSRLLAAHAAPDVGTRHIAILIRFTVV
jgi:hypothetical protein